MKKIICLCLILLLISCKKDVTEYYPNGNLKTRIEVNDKQIPNGLYEEFYETGEIKCRGKYNNGKAIDTVNFYYRNGSVKEKGLFKDKLKIGWWKVYDEKGLLNKIEEFIILKNYNYKNQVICFDKKGDTIFEKSSFYHLILPDTLKLGKNIGEIKYNSNFKTKDKFIYVLIDNQLAENKISKDTFNEEPKKTRFGVYAYKAGKKIVKGEILETILETKIINKDSSSLTVKEHRKYFEKKVFVK